MADSNRNRDFARNPEAGWPDRRVPTRPYPGDPRLMFWPAGAGFGPSDYVQVSREEHGYAPPGEHREHRGREDRSEDRTRSGFGPYAWAGAGLDARDDHRGRGPRGYNRSDDRIREDICDRLSEDGLVDATEVEITVAGGEVTLAGTVESRAERRRAEDLVEKVSGVKHVSNSIRVRDRRPERQPRALWE